MKPDDRKVYPEYYAGPVVHATPYNYPPSGPVLVQQPMGYDTSLGVQPTPVLAYPQSITTTTAYANPDLPYPQGRPQVITQQPINSDRWKSPPCDCCVDGGGVCCLTCCCPCVPIGYHAELVGWNCCLTATAFALLYSPSWAIVLIFGYPAPPLSCIIHAPLRRKLRVRYGIVENCSGEDFLCTFFCPLCSICQEIHEVRSHGETRI